MSKYEDYNNVAKEYDKRRAPVGSDVIAALVQFYRRAPLKDLHVLDAGSGTGNYAKALLDYGTGHVTLLDASRGMLDKAREKLADEIADGRADIVEETLPNIPFQSGKFDAVMINLVLHHLDDDFEFSVALSTLKEARRVLKTNGLLMVTTVLPDVIKHAIWYCQLCPSLTERFVQKMPTEKQLADMFAKSNFRHITSMNILGDQIVDYRNYEGPLSKEWRDTISYWAFATEAEIAEVERKVRELKDSGTLVEWAESKDRVNTCGLLTVLACSAE